MGIKPPVHENMNTEETDMGSYSLVWSGHKLGESYFDLMEAIKISTNLNELKENLKSKVEKWNSMNVNLLCADTEGNIGYALLSSIPLRNNSVPFTGGKIINGANAGTTNDWINFDSFSKLPFHLNSEKGYYMNANNQPYPAETAFLDIGATQGPTSRSKRLTELIEEKIAKGHKFTTEDMIEMQQDVMDVQGREIAPHVLKLCEKVLSDSTMKHNLYERQGWQFMLKHFVDFHGSMEEDSIPATVYQYWKYFMYTSLFRDVTEVDGKQKELLNSATKKPFWDAKTRLGLIDNHAFDEFFTKLIVHLGENPTSTTYDSLCKNGFAADKYQENHVKMTGAYCQYNVGWAMLEAKEYLYKKISSDSREWKWGNVHKNTYFN